jgi:hypothetical protein
VLGGEKGLMMQREQKLSAKKEKALKNIDKIIEKIEEKDDKEETDEGEV